MQACKYVLSMYRNMEGLAFALLRLDFRRFLVDRTDTSRGMFISTLFGTDEKV